MDPATPADNGKDAFLDEVRRGKQFFDNTVVAQAQKIEFGPERVTFTFMPAHRTLREQLEQNRQWLESIAANISGKKMSVVSATGLQVTSAVLAGIVWMLENPDCGIVEADEMDFRRCLDIQLPYLGPVIGQYTDWTPLSDRGRLFPENLDRDDPWQFSNVLVS